MSNSRPEADLLRLCATTRLDEQRADRLRALALKGIDWDRLLRAAQRHGVTPLLQRQLSAACPEAIPDEARRQLAARLLRITRHNLFLTAELLHLLGRFESRGLAVLPYKGPILAASAYGDLGLRPFDDLDLFVRRDELARAGELLAAEGYRRHAQLTPAREKRYLATQCEHHFVRADGHVPLELQWDVAPRHDGVAFDFEGLWERSVSLVLNEARVRTLSPEDLLFVLCLHGYKHCWEQLKWICDVAELVRAHPALDWERALEQAAALGCRRMVLLGLCLARRLLEAGLPEPVEAAIRGDPRAERLAAWVGERLFADPPAPPGAGEFIWFRVWARERLRDGLGWCVRRALTPTVEDWEFFRLPEVLSPLYYPLRPIRLAGKHVCRVVMPRKGTKSM